MGKGRSCHKLPHSRRPGRLLAPARRAVCCRKQKWPWCCGCGRALSTFAVRRTVPTNSAGPAPARRPAPVKSPGRIPAANTGGPSEGKLRKAKRCRRGRGCDGEPCRNAGRLLRRPRFRGPLPATIPVDFPGNAPAAQGSGTSGHKRAGCHVRHPASCAIFGLWKGRIHEMRHRRRAEKSPILQRRCAQRRCADAFRAAAAPPLRNALGVLPFETGAGT